MPELTGQRLSIRCCGLSGPQTCHSLLFIQILSIWAWLFFSEIPTNTTVIGAIVIVCAVTYGITGPASEVVPELDPHP